MHPIVLGMRLCVIVRLTVTGAPATRPWTDTQEGLCERHVASSWRDDWGGWMVAFGADGIKLPVPPSCGGIMYDNFSDPLLPHVPMRFDLRCEMEMKAGGAEHSPAPE